MNIENLHIGQEIKNYKELCMIINEPVKAGNSKKNHLKQIGCFCKYHTKGRKFIIDEIYSKPKVFTKTNNAEYIEIIELLFLDYLAQPKTDIKPPLSKNKIIKLFKMINNNYIYSKKQIDKLSVYTDINKETISEFYESTDNMIERNIKAALKNLSNQSLIMWNDTIGVCEIKLIDKDNNKFDIEQDIQPNEYGDDELTYKATYKMTYYHREATDAEKKFILHTERDFLDLYNYSTKQEIIKNGKWKEFKKYITQKLLDKYSIAFYYPAYKILFNEDQIMTGYIKFIEYLMNDDERLKQCQILNKEVAEKIFINITKRHDKSLKEKELNSNISYNKEVVNERRSNDTYLTDNQYLIKLLVSPTKSIKKELSKIKADDDIIDTETYEIVNKHTGLVTKEVHGKDITIRN